MTGASEVVAIATALLDAPSPSGDEGPAVEVCARILREFGHEPRLFEGNIYAVRGQGEPRLLFNSHLDVVPAGEGWTRDPWRATLEGERLYGRGATDAKGSVAAQLAAFLKARVERGTLVWSAVREEETNSNRGAVLLAPHLTREFGRFDGVIIGEPTALQAAIAQRGLLRFKVHIHGKACHASRPWQGLNPLPIAARALLALEELAASFTRENPYLGRTTLVPTMISGGTAPNVIPESCVITYDARTIPEDGHEEVWTLIQGHIEGIGSAVGSRESGIGPSREATENTEGTEGESGIESRVASVVPSFPESPIPDPQSRIPQSQVSAPQPGTTCELVSKRLFPVQSDAADPFVRRVIALSGKPATGMKGLSDMFWFRAQAVVVCGVGRDRESHRADEFVRLHDLHAGAAFYLRLAEEMLRA